MRLDEFIAQLRSDRENRNGTGLYASDKVFALLDRLDSLSALQAEPVACEHEWLDISNKHVLPPAFSCQKCGLVKGTEAEPLYIQWPWLQGTTPMPATVSEEPAKFDAMVPEQERLAIEFCAEIAGSLGKKGSPPDPVRLLEMAEALYLAEIRGRALEAAPAAGGRE